MKRYLAENGAPDKLRGFVKEAFDLLRALGTASEQALEWFEKGPPALDASLAFNTKTDESKTCVEVYEMLKDVLEGGDGDDEE